jgi:hypothetical protein
VAGADEVLLDGTFRHLNNTNPSVGDDIADDGSELFPGR